MLTPFPTLYAISDFRDGWPPTPDDLPPEIYRERWQAEQTAAQLERYLSTLDLERARAETRVVGGYMERLPLACIRAGLVDYAEKWHYVRTPAPGPAGLEQPLFGWRTFHLQDENAPFESRDMLEFIHANGAPHILCAWGLGVSERVMHACRESFKVYYSLDVLPLRVPLEAARHFDLILVSSEWQYDEVRRVHPHIPCEVLSIGPEFADDETFRPLGTPKDYDLIYVACAQPYKRHDVLFEGIARCAEAGRRVRTLCVCGYGEMCDELRAYAERLAIDVDFIGPPGVPFEEVNALMSRAKVGIVAGIEDGCPAILSEYMLAGLPVLTNDHLCCGLRFITAQTGLTASLEQFYTGIMEILDRLDEFTPREEAQARYTWRASVAQFAGMLARYGYAVAAPM